MPWRGLMVALEKHLPENVDGRNDLAYQLVPKALTRLYGPRDQGWESFKNDRGITYVRVLK